MFYGGARGGGKSDFLLIDYTRGLEYGAAHQGILFRRTYREFEELQRRAMELYPRIGGKNSDQGTLWTFPGGAQLHMRHLEHDKDVLLYQGHQYPWIGFDELTNWATDFCYIYMFGCARSPHGIPVRIRASGNPGSVGHVWVKDRFVDRMPPGQLYYDEDTKMTRCFIQALLDDNPIWREKDPDYERRLKNLPPHLFKAHRWGSWDVFAGQVFSELDRRIHACKPFPLPADWGRFASADWGYAKPFSIGWWCVDPDGRMIRYREWYGCQPGLRNTGVELQAKEVAKRSFEMSVGEGCRRIVMDPSCWARQGLEGSSVADTFHDAGWDPEKGNNDRIGGLNRIHDLLKTRGMDGLPLMMAFDTCKDWFRTMAVLVADEKKPEDVDTRGEDHAYDDTRYGAMSTQARVAERTTLGSRRARPRWKEAYDPLANA